MAKPSSAVLILSLLVAVLATLAAGVGLLWDDSGSPVTVATVRGGSSTLYGHGLYRYDTLFTGASNRGTDAVMLVLAIPLLVAALFWYRRGSIRGGLLLTGVLALLLYVYASYAFGIAFNSLFLAYVVLYAASLFALARLLTSFDLGNLPAHFTAKLPRRGPGIFLIASGLLTLIIWLGPLAGALAAGQPPARLGHYTTSITDALDLGIITPSSLLAGTLILRRRPFGYLLAASLLVLEAMLAPLIAAQTVSQLAAGVAFTPGEIIGPMIGFVTLALFAIWVLVAILRGIQERPIMRPGEGT